MAEESYQIALVKDPLSDVSRKERRSLLGVGVLALTFSAGIIPTKISALGIEFGDYRQADLVFIFILVNIYYFFAFIVYAFSDFVAWRVRLIESLINAYKTKELMSEQEFDVHKRVHSDPITKRYGKLALGSSTLRGCTDFALPLVFSAVAIFSLYGTYEELKETTDSQTPSAEVINEDKKSPNKSSNADGEVHPLERTPQSNEESVNAQVHTAKKNVAIQ